MSIIIGNIVQSVGNYLTIPTIYKRLECQKRLLLNKLIYILIILIYLILKIKIINKIIIIFVFSVDKYRKW